jgi:NTP pyrophosphatase (non-canonical NTP hydrolase)
MIETIFKASNSDPWLADLFGEAVEYAEVYVLARQRQKGCDGMGELATMKEEFRDVVDKVIQYCKEKKYISEVMTYDIDSIADEIVKGQDPV